MKKSDSSNNGSSVLLAILIGIPIIAAIIYFKLNAEDDLEVEPSRVVKEQEIAVPDTTTTTEITSVVEDTVSYVAVSDSVGVDTRPAMEAGDEDGYWDGWYDGAENKKNERYDESCAFITKEDKDTYAEYYREGYEKGFKEALSKRSK